MSFGLSGLTIRAKLIAAFAVVIALGIIGYFQAVSATRAYMQSVSTTGAAAHRAISIAKDASLASNTMARETMAYVYTQKQGHWDAKYAADDAASKAFETLKTSLNSIPHHNDLQQQLDELAKQDGEVCNILENKTMDMAKAGHTREAEALYQDQYVPARAKLEEMIGGLVANLQTQADQTDAGIDEGARRTQRAIAEGWALQGLILLISASIAIFLAKSIASQLRALLQAAEGLAQGDVQQELPPASRTEIGMVVAAFHSLMTHQKEMASAASAIADGDLTNVVQPQSDHDALGTAFARMTISLRELIGGIAGSANAVAATSVRLSTTSEDTSRSASEIARSTQSMAQTAAHSAECSDLVTDGGKRQYDAACVASDLMVQAGQAVDQAAGSAQQMATAAQQAAAMARSGGDAVHQTISSMERIRQQVGASASKVEELGRKSEQIGEIVKTIGQISEQTNLLALNAAIEAARAGEHGRGFAVVADEVRKLSERAASATRDIGMLIGGIQSEVAGAVQAMQESTEEVTAGAAQSAEAGVALSDIVQAAQSVAFEVDSLTATVEEMAASVQEVLKTVETVRQVTQESQSAIDDITGATAEFTMSAQGVSNMIEQQTASVHQVSMAATELNAMADTLQGMVGRFRMNAPATHAPQHLKRAA
ncbi:MAG: HAMP domain-containing methyl-accepting chemotaxis protein [Capsulimonas sp.]|uniref:methyl-accepting chemotaxis protein n=1 Tax=Capsulimonas sp. TaxID=2494211 RepID=UPI0032632C9F